MSEKRIVIDPDPAWREEGRALARRVRDALAPFHADVDHVGSTAVPGLAAKGVIDLQALVLDLDDPGIAAALIAAGFRHRPDTTMDHPRPGFGASDADAWRKLYFTAPPGARDVHLHVRRMGAANATVALLQRDFLRADAPVRADWERLKRALAAHTHDRAVYADLKEPATTLLLRLALEWAKATRWRPGASDAPAGGDRSE
jgi:dephospho-CoA kinase